MATQPVSFNYYFLHPLKLCLKWFFNSICLLLIFETPLLHAATYNEVGKDVHLSEDKLKDNQFIRNFQDLVKLEEGEDNEANNQAEIARKEIITGFTLLKNGNINESMSHFKKAWDINPNSTSAGIILGLNHLQKKEYSQALNYANSIKKTKPIKQNAIGYTLEGLVYSSQDKLDDAIQAFKQTLKQLPNEKNALMNLASIEASRKNRLGAEKYLEHLLNLDRTFWPALNLLADIELRTDKPDYDKAQALLKRAINNHPQVTKPLVTLIKSYLVQKKYEEILNLTTETTDPVLLELKAKALLNSGQMDKAGLVFEEIIKRLPESSAAHFLIAEFYARIGNIDKTEFHIKRSINLDNTFLPARVAEIKTLFYAKKVNASKQAQKKLEEDFGQIEEVLSISAWLAFEAKDYAKSENYYQQLFDLNKNTTNVLLLFKSIWFQGNQERGFDLLKTWMNNNPSDKDVEIAIADSYMGIPEYDKAKQAYQKIIKKFPDAASAYNNLSWLIAKDDIKKAIRYAKKAHALEKNNAFILDTLAMLLLSDNELKQASQYAKKAATILPNNAEIVYHYADILVREENYADAKQLLNQLKTMHINFDSGIGKGILDLIEKTKNK